MSAGFIGLEWPVVEERLLISLYNCGINFIIFPVHCRYRIDWVQCAENNSSVHGLEGCYSISVSQIMEVQMLQLAAV